MNRRTRVVLPLALLGAALNVSTAHAQAATTCESAFDRNTGVKLPSGEFNNFVGGHIVVRCPSKNLVLHADSAEIYGDEARIFFVGHVRYDEPRFNLVSDYLTYFQREERVLASGNVVAKLPSGSTLRGPQAEYRRVAPRVRTRAQVLAIGRPTVSIVQRDRSGKEEPPVDVVANTIFMDGDSLIYGAGQVRITRPEVTASSDSAFINSGTEIMQLLREPSVTGSRGRPFRLVGERIDLFSRERKLQRVVAAPHAVATSQELTLRSDTIDLRITSDQLERAFAWGASRARATSPSQNMLADSLDVQLPGQRVREVHAVRRALAEGRPDSTKFIADTTDWLRGDTIVAYFDTLPPRDTTKGPSIRQLVSTDSAQAYYHLAASDTTQRRAAISYTRGHQITVSFDSQSVASVAVVGKVAGIYLEPTDSVRAGAVTRQGARPTVPAVSPRPPVGAPPAGTTVVPRVSTPVKRP